MLPVDSLLGAREACHWLRVCSKQNNAAPSLTGMQPLRQSSSGVHFVCVCLCVCACVCVCVLHLPSLLARVSTTTTTTVHELLLADDCALNTTSEEEMQRSMDLFSAACENIGLVINTQKTVVMHQPPPNSAATAPNAPPPQISVNGTQLQVVETSRIWAVLSPTTQRSTTKLPAGSPKPVKHSDAYKTQSGIVTAFNSARS
ncbi:hypothetical protein SprV_1002824800 [Sparganum proliferum]